MSDSVSNPIRTARDTAMDCIGLNEQQRRRLANANPGRDSLFEHLQHMRSKYAISDEDALPAFQALRELITLNDEEYHGERQITGICDDLIRIDHELRRPRLVADSAPSIKRLAALLRPHLQALTSPAGRTARELVEARRAVVDIVRSTPLARLQCDSLRHELRATAHDHLLSIAVRAA